MPHSWINYHFILLSITYHLVLLLNQTHLLHLQKNNTALTNIITNIGQNNKIINVLLLILKIMITKKIALIYHINQIILAYKISIIFQILNVFFQNPSLPLAYN
jgi:hypothetical protein